MLSFEETASAIQILQDRTITTKNGVDLLKSESVKTEKLQTIQERHQSLEEYDLPGRDEYRSSLNILEDLEQVRMQKHWQKALNDLSSKNES